jgi:O-antigen/teichoic acid export membrane protein
VNPRLRELSQLPNSLALIAAKGATMGLGFFFWLLAARLFSRSDVGVAAGIVAAMMLCTQLALLGIGSSVISYFREHQSDTERLVNSALTLVSGAAALAAGVFLLVASALPTLDAVVASPWYAASFVVASVTGTVAILFDQISTVGRRGDQALVRGALFGLAAIACLVTVSREIGGSQGIFLPWAVAGLLVLALGLAQFRRSLHGYRTRPLVDIDLAQGLLRLGLPNQILTLAERTPGLIMPILVAELVSASANAAWYAAWMMAWVIYIIPVQVGMTTFAEAARDPASFSHAVRRGLRISLVLGSAGAIVMALAGGLPLSLMGPTYVKDGLAPLRILTIGVVPMCFTFAYFAACRGLRRPGEASVLGWASTAAAIGAAALAAPFGLTWMAAAWLCVQLATGACAAWRLRRLQATYTAQPSRRAPAPVDLPVPSGVGRGMG